MSIQSKKRETYSKIASSKTLANANKRKIESLESFNNKKGKIVDYLTDVISLLVGFIVLVNAIVDTLTFYLVRIEKEIKKGLKSELKIITSCGVNPSLPVFLKSTGNGIVIDVSKVDFFDIFKIDPTTKSGQLIYNDTTNQLSSTDFNTFMYAVIQNDGTTNTWSSNGKNILDIRFDSIGTTTRPNNSLTIKANVSYDNKKLTDLNNDFIDSLTLFNSKEIVNRIIDSIYGSISFTVNKSKKQLINEAKINTVINKLIDADANEQITDDFFTFTNDETAKHGELATLRQQGIHKINLSNQIDASVPVKLLNNFTDEMNVAQSITNNGESLAAQKDIIASNLNKMAEATTAKLTPILPIPSNLPNLPKMPSISALPDKATVKLNFASDIFKNLTTTIVSTTISPKVIMIFLINLKIIYGEDAVYEDGVDFIKKNKNIFKSVIRSISKVIIAKLMRLALKEIAKLMVKVIIKRNTEKTKQRKSQVLSLSGQNQETLNNLKI